MTGFSATVTRIEEGVDQGRFADVGTLFTSINAAITACERSAATARLELLPWRPVVGSAVHESVSECRRFLYQIVRHS